MKTIEIKNLPRISFAHEYSAINYVNDFEKRSSYIEVSYVVEGAMNHRTPSSQFVAHTGDVVCWTYDAPCSVSAEKSHTHRTVCANIEWCDTPQGIMLPHLLNGEDCAQLRALIDNAVFAQNSYLGSPAREAQVFLNILCEIDRITKKTASGDGVYARRAMRYVAKNIRKPLTQREVAEHLGITPGYLCAVFKKTQGQTLMQYINKSKLMAVRGIMKRENLHLYEAAALYGFTDPNYASRLYKKLFLKNITD